MSFTCVEPANKQKAEECGKVTWRVYGKLSELLFKVSNFRHWRDQSGLEDLSSVHVEFPEAHETSTELPSKAP